MHSVCRLRLYTENDRLLIGRSQFADKQEPLHFPESNNITQHCKAMSTHTNDIPDLGTPTNNNTILDETRNPSSSFSYISCQPDTQVNNSPNLHLPAQSVIPAASLDLILVKLNKLDTIKTHLTTIDFRLDHLQPQSNITGLVAQRF